MKIIAHRANDGINKENSLKAIVSSLDKPYVDGVEFDVRMTKDYKFVIHHDPFYNGFLIRNTKRKQLIGLDILEDVLNNINTNKILLIEIKEESQKYKILLAKLYNILKKYNLNYYIFSFNYNLMKYFKENYPFKAGLLIGIKKNLNKTNTNFDFYALNYHHSNINLNKETFIWTVNSKEQFQSLKTNDNVITDKAKYVYEMDMTLWQTLK